MVVTCKSYEVICFHLLKPTALSLVLTLQSKQSRFPASNIIFPYLWALSHLRVYFALPAQQQMTEKSVYNYPVSFTPYRDDSEIHALHWCSEFPSEAQPRTHHILRALHKEDPPNCNFWREARQETWDAGSTWQLRYSERSVKDKVLLPLLACPVSASSTTRAYYGQRTIWSQTRRGMDLSSMSIIFQKGFRVDS